MNKFRKSKQRTLIPITRDLKKLRETDYLAFLKEFQKKSLEEYKKQRVELDAQMKEVNNEYNKFQRIKEIEKEIEKNLEEEQEQVEIETEDTKSDDNDFGFGVKRF